MHSHIYIYIYTTTHNLPRCLMRLKLVFDAILDFEIEQNFTNPLF
jgi:hypothetical protein